MAMAPRHTRDVPLSLDARSGLDGGVRGLRIGFLNEGLANADANATVRDSVLAAAEILAEAGAALCKVSVPEHTSAYWHRTT